MMNGIVKFQFGRLLATPDALKAIEASGKSAADFLARHAAGDWGDVDAEDAAANEAALLDGSRLLSVYHAGSVKLYIITEACDDEGRRSATTILLADEY
jgi:hypothetical protein